MHQGCFPWMTFACKGFDVVKWCQNFNSLHLPRLRKTLWMAFSFSEIPNTEINKDKHVFLKPLMKVEWLCVGNKCLIRVERMWATMKPLLKGGWLYASNKADLKHQELTLPQDGWGISLNQLIMAGVYKIIILWWKPLSPFIYILYTHTYIYACIISFILLFTLSFITKILFSHEKKKDLKRRFAWFNYFTPDQVSGGLNVKLAARPAEDSSVHALLAPQCGSYVEDLGNNIFDLMCHRAAFMSQ